MIVSMNDITVYAVNDKDTATEWVMRVTSGSRHAGAVDVVLDGKRYTVNGADIIKAVNNAMNK